MNNTPTARLPDPIPPLRMVWRDAGQQPQPNTWTYFRRTVNFAADKLPQQAFFAADPTARLWINGCLVIDRTMRFVTPHIPLERIGVEPFLRVGENTVTILHHWWGVPTFQRSPGGAPGVFFRFAEPSEEAAAEQTGWQWRQADEFTAHPYQTLGHDGSHRIRFPLLLDQRQAAEAGRHTAGGDGHIWQPAITVGSAAWERPLLKETPPLHSDTVLPQSCVASGSICRSAVQPTQAHEVGKRIRESRHIAAPTEGRSKATEEGNKAGSDHAATAIFPHRLSPDSFLTLDFGKPVHGFLRLEIEAAQDGAILEIGYGELAVDPRNNKPLLSASGHFDPEFTCGAPFGDQVILRKGRQSIFLPDERTWRWLILHCLPPHDAPATAQEAPLATLRTVNCKTSQHPVRLIGSFQAADATGAQVPENSACCYSSTHRPDGTTQAKPTGNTGPASAAPTAACGSTTQSAAWVDALVRLCLDHAQVSMSDAYVDTTGREDAQWLEDIQYRARLSASWFGDSALRQVTLRHAVEQQDQSSGLFRVFAPEDYGQNGCQLLDWGMAWIGLLYDDWRWSGSTQRIERYYPALKKFTISLNHLTNADGLLTGWLCLADNHGSERLDHSTGGTTGEGCESIPNTWYYGYLRQAAQMARAINRDADADAFEERAQRVLTGFQRFYTTLDEGGRSMPTISEVWTPHTGPRGYGQAAVVNAIFHGLVTDSALAKEMLLAAFPAPEGIPAPDGSMKRWNTPTTIYRVLQVLCTHDLGHIACAHLQATYGPSLPDGPLPEYFLPGKGQPIDPTGSHGWAAVPLAWLHDTVLGVQHEHTGSSDATAQRIRIRVHPRYAGWRKVSGTVATPAGPVSVAIDWQESRITIQAPPDIEVLQEFPDRTPSEKQPQAAKSAAVLS